MHDEYEDDSWVHEFSEVPAELRPILRQYGNIRNLNLAYAVAAELGLPTDQLRSISCRVLLKVMYLLAGNVRGEDPARNGAAVAYAATEGLTVDDAREVLMAFGGGELRVESTVRFWDVDARKLLADHLTPNVQSLFSRWADRSQGAAAPANRRVSRVRK